MKKSIVTLGLVVFLLVSAMSAEPMAVPTDDHAIGECAFRIAKTQGLRFQTDKESRFGAFGVGHTGDPDFWAVQLACEAYTADLLPRMAGVHREDGTYVLSSALISEQRAKLIVLRGSNWTGAGSVTESTTGEPVDRYRRFKFCIVRGAKALCGWSDVVTHLSHPEKSTLQKVLRTLESIEFIEG